MRSPFQSIIYIQLLPSWMSVRVLSWAGGDSRWDGVPEFITVRNQGHRLKAVDSGTILKAEWTDAQKWSLLSHPRTIIDSVEVFALGLRLFCTKAGLKGSISKPILLYHIRQDLAGGLTDVERTSLLKAAKTIDVRAVLFVDEDHELDTQSILACARQS
jgi:hypothetical protein